ncbi:MAG: diadenylate cyclase CdaA [Candidatus Omnitrophota bacterium]|jgi:diadenylate cyclase|nr:diadenylate cyclase CdaA [Candidatus Omnitrophota bacterium]
MHFLSYLKIGIEIIILWYAIYMILVFIKGTRTEQLLKGVVIIGAIFVIAQQCKLDAILWVMVRLFPLSVLALVIIFQPELRRGLARLGQFGIYQEDGGMIEEISRCAGHLSGKRIGALIAIEREVGLKNYIESGVLIDGKVTKELLISIFSAKAPLHDGAVIIQHGRIVAAGCLLPLTQEANILKSLGTRHRAALGLSEETDAVCIVVSEETGSMSISMSGKLMYDLSEENLLKMLKEIFFNPHRLRGKRLLKMLSKLSPSVSEKGR